MVGRANVMNPQTVRGSFQPGAMSSRRRSDVARPDAVNGPGDEILLQLRNLLLGNAQQESEAQYGALVDKLETHATQNAERMQALEGRLKSAATATAALRNDYDALDTTFNRFIEAAGREREDLRNTFIQAMEDLEAEMDSKVEALTKSVWTKMQQSASVSDRAFKELAEEADMLKREIVEHSRTVNASTDKIFEQRIAQWRAEIDDDRADDMRKVASALLDLGTMIDPTHRKR